MNRPIHAVLLHAYSSRNSGDGLLVDLSIELLRDAFGPHTSVSVVAADPPSFRHLPHVYPAPVLASTRGRRLGAAALAPLAVASNPALADLRTLLDSAHLIVGVGGGYLRARTAVEALKLEAGHLLQMRATRSARRPTVYLPQSIGPVADVPYVAPHLKGLLATFDDVFVRDDRSAAFLAGNANTRRAPDLAVLQFGRSRDSIVARVHARGPAPAHVAFVLRKPPAWNDAQRRRYHESTAALIELMRARCRVTFAVQSTGRGNDDAAYYRERGIEATRSLRDVLAHDRPDAVISVRLHGALESILQGVPAYHLSYERKGFGAYADLGVPDWVANAADFDPAAVARTISAAGSLTRFWAATGQALADLQQAREQVVSTLRARVHGRPT